MEFQILVMKIQMIMITMESKIMKIMMMMETASMMN